MRQLIMTKIHSILIIGHGTMGKGISRLLTANNFEVTHIGARNFLADEVSKELNKNFDLVLETAAEDMDIKLAVIQKIADTVSAGVIATGTSSISIKSIQNRLTTDKKLIGIHFMNPPSVIPIVEIVGVDNTTEDVVTSVAEWLTSFAREPIIVSDRPGFALNAMLFSLLNSAVYTYEQTKLSAAEIDQLMITVCGHKLGPLRTLDLVGIDTALAIIRSLHEANPTVNARPSSVLQTMIHEGRLGRKSKRGFYEY
jgi:3-hydroxyacyl-CoA dehydrogenase